MSKNMKAFLARVSSDEKLIEQLKAAKEYDEVLALAKEIGMELTLADIEPVPESDELTEDELNTISGGDTTGYCICVAAGGGGGKHDGDTYGCACVAYGEGGDGKDDHFVCWCVGYGDGNNTIEDGDILY